MPSSEDSLFRDRHDAGRQLADRLKDYGPVADGLVVALPRGGVVVGYEIALALRLPLDVFVTRKLGTPGNPELAMGALSETGYRHVNRDVLQECRVTERELDEELQRQRHEIARRIQQYREGRSLPTLVGRTVILVDDGIATGATFYASVAALRALPVGRVIAAAPVAPPRVRHDLISKVDDVIILHTPALFFGIGQFYDDFSQVEDDEVIDCLARAKAALHKTG